MNFKTKTDKKGRLIEIYVPMEGQHDMVCTFNYSPSVLGDGSETCFARDRLKT